MDTTPATKQDIVDAVDKLASMIGQGLAQNDKRFDALEAKVGRIEKVILADYGRRIEGLENEVKKLKDVIAI